MNTELSISDAAKEDMEDARAWYEDRQSGLGIDFLIALSAVLEKIEENPKQYAVRFGRLLFANFPILFITAIKNRMS